MPIPNIPVERSFDPQDTQYDAIIIGAGMSGMAAAIRLGMYDKKVLLLEKHVISGGLNSYYSRSKLPFDVGLHALTNFAARSERRKPLTKLLKQLRIPYDEFKLTSQYQSQISFPDTKLQFSNDIELLISEIEKNFFGEKENFLRLLEEIKNFNEVALDNPYESAKEKLAQFIKTPLLREMIMAPLLIYGSAWEMDMDYSQFVIMFKSIYLEGFGRPEGGVRTIIQVLLNKLKENNVEVCYRNGVEEIITQNGQAVGVKTTRGQTIHSPLILSSAGLPETMKLTDAQENSNEKKFPETGKMSFTEAIYITKQRPSDYGQDNTIIFYNNRNEYQYKRPEGYVDPQSAVICFPNNFRYGQNHAGPFEDDFQQGVLRITMMANYNKWKEAKEIGREEYLRQKEQVHNASVEILAAHLPKFNPEDITFKDIFTPTTVERYTGHFGGCVYGSPDKSRDGTTPIKGLVVCGTDQGFLGIIGSMLSGISMANLYGLMGAATTENK